MLLKIPIELQIAILSFVPIKDIYLSYALVSSVAQHYTKNKGLYSFLQEIYFHIQAPLKQAVMIQLPLWGDMIDGYCPQPEKWIDSLFTRTKNKQITIQNCKSIHATLSKLAEQFRMQLKKNNYIIEVMFGIKNPTLQKTSLDELYRTSFKLSEKVFSLPNGFQKQEITQNVMYFWNRMQLNKDLLQTKGQIGIPDYKAVLKRIKIKTYANTSQRPQQLCFSINDKCLNPFEQTILRTNMIEYKADSLTYDESNRPYLYCVFAGSSILWIDMLESTKVNIEFLYNESVIFDQLSINVLQYAIGNGMPGSSFEYIQCFGYQL